VDSKQLWARNLANGDVAVALYNKDVGQGIDPPFAPTTDCPADKWVGGEGAGGYYEACGGAGGDVGTFTNLTVAEAQAKCCGNKLCAGFSYVSNLATTGDGFFKGNANCGFTKSSTYTGYVRACDYACYRFGSTFAGLRGSVWLHRACGVSYVLSLSALSRRPLALCALLSQVHPSQCDPRDPSGERGCRHHGHVRGREPLWKCIGT
jgi:hypothetical protein